MEITLGFIPYEYRFAAATLLMSRGNKLLEKADLFTHRDPTRFVTKVLEAIAYFDMALLLIKRFDPNYQTLLNWKCQALISIGQFEDARRSYEELIRVADESDGQMHRGPTAALALTQLASVAGKINAPLPPASEASHQLFDTPPFCTWAQEACRLLFKGKIKQFHQCLSPPLQESHSPERLKQLLTNLKKHFTQDLEIRLAHYEFGSQCDSKSSVGWCGFSQAHGSDNQSLIVGVSRTATNAFEIDTLRWEPDQ